MREPSRRSIIAALTPVSREVDKWFLEEYYLFQALSEKWSVIAGRIMFSGIGDLNRFAGNEKTQFLNTSLRNSPLLGIISQATSLHGAAVNYSPNPDIIISPFVLSNNDVDGTWGSPGGLFDEYSAGLQLQFSWEVAGLKGYISPLFGYTSVNASDLDNSRLIFDAIEGYPDSRQKRQLGRRIHLRPLRIHAGSVARGLRLTRPNSTRSLKASASSSASTTHRKTGTPGTLPSAAAWGAVA